MENVVLKSIDAFKDIEYLQFKSQKTTIHKYGEGLSIIKASGYLRQKDNISNKYEDNIIKILMIFVLCVEKIALTTCINDTGYRRRFVEKNTISNKHEDDIIEHNDHLGFMRRKANEQYYEAHEAH